MILEERESILRSFYESGLMLMGVIELDGDDIRWVSENVATAHHLGTTPEAMKHKTAREIGISEEECALWVARRNGPARRSVLNTCVRVIRTSGGLR